MTAYTFTGSNNIVMFLTIQYYLHPLSYIIKKTAYKLYVYKQFLYYRVLTFAIP